MNLNYTCICWYCGDIYKANRSTSKYCCREHNSLYNANGSQIDYTILNNHGKHVSYHEILSEMYDTWTKEALRDEGYTDFYYNGPLPKANELLIVSGFLIKKINNAGDIGVKPIYLLNKEEMASGRIITPDLSHYESN